MERQDVSRLLFDDDMSGGMIKHKSAKRINEAGKASAMAISKVAQAVKERELNERERKMEKDTIQNMMSSMLAKQQADTATQDMMSIAKQLSMQQALLDGKMAAMSPPPLPPDPMMGQPMPPDPMMGQPMPPEQPMPMAPPDMPSEVPAQQVTAF